MPAGAEANLINASDRIQEGKDAGTEYFSELQSIRNVLVTQDEKSSTLGTMVGAQLEMTEVETKYMVKSGLPKKASAAVQAAAQDVKKASGG
jgi:hypothetical protein